MSNLRSVRQDSIGLWVSADGLIARPVGKSKWNAGDKVNARRETGIVFVRDEDFDEEYEVWATMSMMTHRKKNYMMEQQKELWDYYRKDALRTYGFIYWKEEI
jgi:hypothetical protein